jgi:hypothetical protein
VSRTHRATLQSAVRDRPENGRGKPCGTARHLQVHQGREQSAGAALLRHDALGDLGRDREEFGAIVAAIRSTDSDR